MHFRSNKKLRLMETENFLWPQACSEGDCDQIEDSRRHTYIAYFLVLYAKIYSCHKLSSISGSSESCQPAKKLLDVSSLRIKVSNASSEVSHTATKVLHATSKLSHATS